MRSLFLAATAAIIAGASTAASPEPRHTTPEGVRALRVFLHRQSDTSFGESPCPRTLRFGGEIAFHHTGDGKPVEIRYRYRSSEKASPLYVTTFERSGRKSLQFWSLRIGFRASRGQPAKVYGGTVRLEIVSPLPEKLSARAAETSYRVTCPSGRIPGSAVGPGR